MVAQPHPESEGHGGRRRKIVRRLNEKLAVTERIDEFGRRIKAAGGAAGHVVNQASHKQREFASVEHLSAEAIAAFVDDELTPGAANRARIHLVHCAECRAEVNHHRAAAERLRRAGEDNITAPSSLLNKLASIADSCPDGPETVDSESSSKSLTERAEVFYRAVKKIQGK